MVNDSFCRVNEKKKKKKKPKMRSRGSNLRRLSVPLQSDALTIEPPKLQNAKAQTQQYKPKLRLFRTRNLFYYRNIVLYYRKCNIFDNIKNIIAILDALMLIDSLLVRCFFGHNLRTNRSLLVLQFFPRCSSLYNLGFYSL